jgi:PmbA protein
MRESAIDDAITKALAIAKFTGQDPFAGLAPKELMAHHYPELDLYHPWDITPEQGIDLAKTCEAEALSIDSRLTNSEGAGVATHQGILAYANSHGFSGAYHASYHSMDCSLIGEQEGAMQRDGDYTVARDALELLSVTQLARQAAQRTVSRLGARSLSTGKYPVIFKAEVAKTLLGHLVQAISGGALYRRASFLVDKLGKPIFANAITIRENPHLLRGLGSTPFDHEGVLTGPRTFVEQGMLESYVLSSYSGRQLGMPTTANAGGVHNLSIQPTHDYDLDDLLQAMGSGLLVTELMGQGVNIVTGDYSRGAAGYWIENGKIAYPVEEITIASTLPEMFMGIQAVGNDIDVRGNMRTGSIWIGSMTVAGST